MVDYLYSGSQAGTSGPSVTVALLDSLASELECETLFIHTLLAAIANNPFDTKMVLDCQIMSMLLVRCRVKCFAQDPNTFMEIQTFRSVVQRFTIELLNSTAVQAGLEKCWISTQDTPIQSSAGAKSE